MSFDSINENTPKRSNDSIMMSPHSMAVAALNGTLTDSIEDVVENSSVNRGNDSIAVTVSAKRRKIDSTIVFTEKDNIKRKIEDLYEEADSELDLQKVNESTKAFFKDTLASMVKYGSNLRQEVDTLQNKMKLLHGDLADKDGEVKRLRHADEMNRKAIANLMATVNSSKKGLREASNASLATAELRAKLDILSQKYSEQISETEVAKRKIVLLEEEVHQTKNKLAHVNHEKIKLERDKRVAMTMNKVSDKFSNEDTLKRKIEELTKDLESANEIILEQKEQIESAMVSTEK